jgi:DNA-binding SARP family transcriptional activator
VFFKVLGDVSVVDDTGSATRIRAGRQRAVLAMLTLEANTVVSRAALIDGVWGDRLPETPDAALHVAVSRLRSQLGSCGGRITAEPGGYRLDAGWDEVDVLLAEALLRDGRNSLAMGDSSAAANAFERALGSWTGDALHDLNSYQFCELAARRLNDLRIALVEARNDAYLGDSRHLEVLADAERWIDAEPWREHLRAQHVVALYRAGRQAEALRACEDLRKTLRNDLGLEPSVEMQELEHRVLDQDSTLRASESGVLTPLPEWTAQALPFVGRVEEHERVIRALAEASTRGIRLVLVEGPGGIGKSRFLLNFARSVARDAIVIPLQVNHLWESTLHALARAMAEASLALSEEDLEFIVRGLPEVPQDIAFLRSVARSVISGDDVAAALNDADILTSGARWLAALSAKAPVVILVDDFDTAGTPLNHIVGKLVALSTPKRVLVVGSARGPVGATAPQVAQLVSAMTERGLAETITLAPLTPEDIDALLARMRIAPRELLVERLAALTGGHPLVLAEILSSGPVERVIDDWAAPPRVADVVRRRTAELGRATADVVRAASLFEGDFSVELLAEVMDAREATVAELLDRAVEAHVVQPTSARSYRFAHRMYPQTLARDMGDQRQARGHRRIATVLEQRGGTAASVLASHWARAEGSDASQKIALYARAAAQDAMALFEPHSAMMWLELAANHVGEEERGTLLLELAEAQQFAGDPRGIESLCEAVSLALDHDDDALTLRILGARLPGWSTLPGVTSHNTRRFLSRALLIANDDVACSRVNAWLAAELALECPAESAHVMDRALAFARASNDQTALADCLMRFAATAAAPHVLDRRHAAVAELLEIASPLDVTTRYYALSTLGIAAIQAGDVRQADIAIAESDAIAGQFDLGPLRWSRLVGRAWRMALAGDLSEAAHFIGEAARYGEERGIAAALDTGALQSGLLMWQQGRFGERAEQIRANYARVVDRFPAVPLVLARALAEHASDREEARAIVATFAHDAFASVRTATFWSSLLLLTAETALLAGMPEASAQIRDLLLPFADQVAHAGMWVTGPIAYGVAVACAGCGDSRADAYLALATNTAAQLGAPLFAEQARQAAALVPH